MMHYFSSITSLLYYYLIFIVSVLALSCQNENSFSSNLEDTSKLFYVRIIESSNSGYIVFNSWVEDSTSLVDFFDKKSKSTSRLTQLDTIYIGLSSNSIGTLDSFLLGLLKIGFRNDVLLNFELLPPPKHTQICFNLHSGILKYFRSDVINTHIGDLPPHWINKSLLDRNCYYETVDSIINLDKVTKINELHTLPYYRHYHLLTNRDSLKNVSLMNILQNCMELNEAGNHLFSLELE